MTLTIVRDDSLIKPRGYSHGIIAEGGKVLFIAGQGATNAAGDILHPGDIVGQFTVTMKNFVKVLEAAGTAPEHVIMMNIFVKDIVDYRSKYREIGKIYKDVFGDHFPALTMVEVSRMVHEPLLVEIQGMAVVPDKKAG